MADMEVIFVIADDNMLYVHSASDELNGAYEGIDVEDGLYKFFDCNGLPLKAEFEKPNKQGKLLGSLGWVASGNYRLIPDHPSEDRLIKLLDGIQGLDSNPYFNDLHELQNYLLKKNSP